jgi:hypothetical protein
MLAIEAAESGAEIVEHDGEVATERGPPAD